MAIDSGKIETMNTVGVIPHIQIVHAYLLEYTFFSLLKLKRKVQTDTCLQSFLFLKYFSTVAQKINTAFNLFSAVFYGVN